MTRAIRVVVWDWLPGFAAGLIPLLVFLFVSVEASPPPTETAPQWWAKFDSGLVDHLLILAMVTSAVSIFSSFPRLFRGAKRVQGSLVLMILVTVTLVMSVAMYVLREANAAPAASLSGNSFSMCLGLALAASVISYYLEVTVTNLGLRNKRQRKV